ncbi:MAG: hypothetical protein QM607_05880 [Microbacterium sp.]
MLLARSHGDDDWSLIGGYGGPDLFITYPNGDQCADVTTAYECHLDSDASFLLEADELRDVAWFAPEQLSDLAVQPWVARILRDSGEIRAKRAQRLI